MQTAAQFDLESIWFVRWLFVVRGLLLGGKPEPRKPSGLLRAMIGLGWGILEEQPGRAIVFGAVTEPWKATVRFEPLAPGQFAAYAEPGRVKIAWTLEARPGGEAITLFQTETRAVATDATARRRFRLYWAFAGIGTALIRIVALRALRTAAERAWGAGPS